MKIYKIKKKHLKFNEEMPQTEFEWKLPILINKDYEVVAGNSLRDVLPEEVLVIVADFEKTFYLEFFDMEKVIVEENSMERFALMQEELKSYIKSFFVKDEQLDLFSYVDYQCINEKNYKLIEFQIREKAKVQVKKTEEYYEDELWMLRSDEEQ